MSLGLSDLPGTNHTQVPPILGMAGMPASLPVSTFGMVANLARTLSIFLDL